LELHAYLWRDFMPICPPNGRNLVSVNRLVDMDSVRIPDNIILSQQFVINGDSLWVAEYKLEERETKPYIIEKISVNGPKWATDIVVKVIVKVIDLNDNSEYYLRREKQPIQRTS